MQNKKTISIVIIIIVLVLTSSILLAILTKNSTNKSTSDKTSTSITSTETSVSTSIVDKTNRVSINNFAFTEKSITVKKGSTVTWTNNDNPSHTVTFDNSNDKSKILGSGDEFKFTFNTVGTFTYHCDFHPSMTGTVIVTE